jgi:3-hydroxyacyl-CoA dehydrogenase
MIQVKKAGVLGAGTMGAQIAAHLANAGIPTLLLDIVPKDEADRNKIARAGLEAAKKSRPAAFFTADRAALVSVGNLEDDLQTKRLRPNH